MSPTHEPVESPDASTVFGYHDLAPPTTADVLRARRTLREVLDPTPLVRSPWLSDAFDAEVYLKREDTLPTGSFKIRGATNLLASLDEAFLGAGVVTASTGNFGRAVAQAARWFDTDAVVAVPRGTGRNQIAGIERLGGRVEVVGEDYDESAEWAVDLAVDRGYRYVHPGNERLVIAGAGTCGLEIAHSLPDVDLVTCPIGAGSIAAGCALSVGAVTDARVVGVQAANVDAVARAWRTGDLAPGESADTFAEGIAARVPFAVPVEVMRERLDAVYTVEEERIVDTVAELFEEERILMEGASAPAIAVLEKLRDEVADATVAIPVTGRNLPMRKLERALWDG